MAYPVAVLRTSHLEQLCCAVGDAMPFMAWSVVASVQCCIVMAAVGALLSVILISQRPALRIGSWSAPAAFVGSGASRTHPMQQRRSRRIMSRPSLAHAALKCFDSFRLCAW